MQEIRFDKEQFFCFWKEDYDDDEEEEKEEKEIGR